MIISVSNFSRLLVLMAEHAVAITPDQTKSYLSVLEFFKFENLEIQNKVSNI